LFSKDFVRACQNLVEIVMDSMALVRVTSHTSDPRMVRLSELAGFEVEGKSPYGMKWDGKFHNSYTLGFVRDTND
jgi:hypothetical protein